MTRIWHRRTDSTRECGTVLKSHKDLTLGPEIKFQLKFQLFISCCISVNSQVAYLFNDAYVYIYHLQGNDVAQGGKKIISDWKLMWVKGKNSSVILVEWSGSCRESRWAQYIQFLSCAEVVWRTRLSPPLNEEKQWAHRNDSSCFKPARCENAEGPDRYTGWWNRKRSCGCLFLQRSG